MTRTDVMASSRPRQARIARRSRLLRRLAVIPAAVLAVALLGPGSAMAAESTTGYSQTPPPPGTTTTTSTTPAPTSTSTTPSTETSPSKESSEPSKEKESSPTTTTTPESKKATSAQLPFTGFDLRWSIAIGLLLMGSGVAIVVVQRRQRQHGER